ncbi:MAG: oligopeptide transporter, OPT family [Lachnospiraceae bacterium]|nr:oligopeptide transporter, OPT family [Lachnospiraceae bacterium]
MGEKTMKQKKELSVVSIILGCLMAVIFGAANAYLGLKVGMTVSASIPAAVISMGIIRFVLRRNSILENNMVQTIGSAGESLAAGAIFTMPALFIWAKEDGFTMPGFLEISLIALCGGILGVLFMVPLRQTLIVEEHGKLPYPEGTACAQVLKVGESGGAKAGTVFLGLGIAGIYKFISEGLMMFPSRINYVINKYKGSAVGVDVLPALVGVGYICGTKTAACMIAGGTLTWLVIMPLISLFGGDAVIYPGDMPISAMTPNDIYDNYIKYIGAGAVAAGGIISLIKSFPLIVRTFTQSVKGFKSNKQDLPMWVIIGGIFVVAVAMWLIPAIPVNLAGALIIIVFGFLFATVSSRMVGLVGSSNNPVSGMTIAALIIVSLLLKVTGNTGPEAMIAAISIGTIVCIVAAMAGDTSQDLKTGFLVGANPKKQQIGELVGAVISAAAIGGVLYLLNQAWGFGSEQLEAPQAGIMKLVVEGVMGGNLPWPLIFAGVFVAVLLEIIGVPVLPFAVGMYLKFHLSAGIMFGGLLRLVVDKSKKLSENRKEKCVENGILFSSGMIAGEGLVGILLAILAIIPTAKLAADGTKMSVGQVIDLSGVANTGNIGAWIFFAALMGIFAYFIFKKDKKPAVNTVETAETEAEEQKDTEA